MLTCQCNEDSCAPHFYIYRIVVCVLANGLYLYRCKNRCILQGPFMIMVKGQQL